jgi:gamma-butyrobetaine dioxygenase
MTIPPVARSIDDIAQLFASPPFDASYGEDVPVRDHMLQCAALAQADGADDALVAAALLHDIGWTLGGVHETSGAAWLRPLLGPAVTRPIELHVMAKRYLVSTSPAYYDRLSDASRATLEQQGGFLDQDACLAFESDPAFRSAIRLREWDDDGKALETRTPGFAAYLPLLGRLI